MIVDGLVYELLAELGRSGLERREDFTKTSLHDAFWSNEYYEEPTIVSAYRYKPSFGYVYRVIRWRNYAFFRHWRSYTLIRNIEENELYVTYNGYNTYTTRQYINWLLRDMGDIWAASRGLYIKGYCNRHVIAHYVLVDLDDHYYGYRKEVIRVRKASNNKRRRFWSRILSMPRFDPSEWGLRVGIAERTWGTQVEIDDNGVHIPSPWCFHIINNTFYVSRYGQDIELRASIHRSLCGQDVLIGKIVALRRFGFDDGNEYIIRDVAIIGRENGIWFTIHVPQVMAVARLDKLEKWCFGIDGDSYLYAQA